MKLEFGGQTALVTGATKGIGRQIAEELAQLGAYVLVTGRNAEDAEKVAETLPGSRHRGFEVDFNDVASTDAFLMALAREQRIDVLVNNAGINRIDPIDQICDDDWDAMQRVNLAAPMRVTRTVSAQMKAQGYGRIVNIASIFGVVSKQKRALYSMTKFGLRGLTVASAHDLAKFGVLVNSVSPGFVRTALTDSILSSEEQAALAAQVPLGRFATPEEIARVVVFLASSLNSYITAQNIVADGGFISA